MNVKAQKFQSLYALVRKPLAWWNHRTTLPQSAQSGCQLPQGGSRERLRGLAPFNRVLAKIQRCGRFSSPLRRLRSFYIPPFIEKISCEIENFPFHFAGICDRMGHGRGCSLKRSEFLSFSLLFFLFGKLAGLWIFLMGWIAETQAGQILTVFILYDTIFIVKVV